MQPPLNQRNKMATLREQPYRSCKKQRVQGSMLPETVDDRCKKQRVEGSLMGMSEPVGNRPFLPVDLLSNAFEYVDVRDTASVALTSKGWAEALRKIEDTLWLTLVRKHHPIIEKLTLLLPASAAAGADGGASLQSSSRSATGSNSTLPPPSRRWKDQFKRRHMLIHKDHSAEVASKEPRTPTPISSYLLQVDFMLYSREKDLSRSHVGLVSTLVEPSFDARGRIKFTVKELEALAKYEFTEFDITLILCEKSTGLQKVVYSGGVDDFVDVNLAWFRSFELTRNVFLSDMPCDAVVFSELYASKNGCVCTCSHGHGLYDGLLVPPNTDACGCGHVCKCCTCTEKWQCILREGLNIELYIELWQYDDGIELEENQQLELFERLDFT